MSEQGSDSEAKDWTVVNQEGEVDGSDDASSQSSLEFVQLDEDAAKFCLRTRSASKSSTDNGRVTVEPKVEDTVTRSTSSSPELVSPSDDEADAADESPMTDPALPESIPTKMTDSKGSDSDASSLEIIGADDLSEGGAPSESPSCMDSPSGLDGCDGAEGNEHAKFAEPQVLPAVNVQSQDTEDQVEIQDGRLGDVQDERLVDVQDDLENEDEVERREDVDEEVPLKGEVDSEDGIETDEDEEERDDMQEEMDEPQAGSSRGGATIDLNCSSDDPPVIAKMKAYLKQFSDSDSDSDFVRLDANMMEEGAVGGVAAAEASPLMSASSSSMTTSSSSVSSNFRFIHPFAMPPSNQPQQQQQQQQQPLFAAVPDPLDQEEDENDPAPGDVDDRCESDISGVAGDTSDLSSVSDQLGDDAPLTADDVPRSYCHQPNERLDAVLTTIALLALFLAVGIGIGHFIGTTRESSLRKQYIVRMKGLQDDYLMCLRDQSVLQNNIKKQPPMEEKFGFLMAAWQEKYQELLMEKAGLEVKVTDLERLLVDNGGQTIPPNTLASNTDKMADHGRHKRSVNEAEKPITIEDNSNADIVELEGHIAAVETLEQELKQRLGDSEERLQEYVKLQAQATETIHALQTRLYQVDEEKQGIIQDVGTLQAQHTQLQITNNQLETEKKHLMAANTHLKEEKAQLQSMKTSLESQNVALVSQLKEEEQQITDLKSQLKTSELQRSKPETTETLNAAQTELELYPAIQKLKDDLNQVEQEKSELLTTLAKLRYMQHPGNVEKTSEVSHVEKKQIKNEMNQLIVENDDLKTTVGKLRYSPHLASEDGVNVDETDKENPAAEKIAQKLIETRRQLAKEKDVAHLWQTLYVAEKVANEKKETGATSSFMTCLSLLLPQVAPGKLGESMLKNATQVLQLQWEFLQNVTRDADFMKKLHARWMDLQRYAGRASEELKYMPDEALALYGILQQALSARWESFVEANYTIPWLKEVFFNATNPEPFKKTVEETRHTVRQLKDTVHNTWEKVRDMSSSFLKQHEAKFDAVKDKVKKKISDMGLKVQSKMEEVQQTLKKSGFFGKQEKENRSQEKRNAKKDGAQPRQEQESDRLHYEKTNDGQTNGKFHDKPSHKQTLSDHEVYKQYQEYWRNSGFEPDDILEEGFFKENNREWRKHQKTVRKIHGRINKLNEDMVTSMDDDEIEDIYDDLEDLQDDLGDNSEQPQKLKNWLTCQIRWWKSRFQRKKRDEDLIRGCGKQMMHWQLRVLCKEVCGEALEKGKGKPCKTCSAIMFPNPKGFHTPPKTVAKPTPSLRGEESDDAFKGKTGKRMDKFSVGSQHKSQEWPESAKLSTSTNFTMGPEGDWFLKMMMARDDNKVNSEWYLSRMEDREDRRHDPRWYIRAMQEQESLEESLHGPDPMMKSYGLHEDFVHHHHDHKREKPKRDKYKRKDHHKDHQDHFSGYDWEEYIAEDNNNGKRSLHHHYRYKKHQQPRHGTHGRHHRHHRSFS